MEKKEITINGKIYPVAFNLKTMMNFEEISGKTFFGEEFTHIKERIALIISAALAADEKTSLTADELIGAQDVKVVQDIMAACKIIMDMAGKFFHIPEIEKKNNPEPPKGENDDDKPKN